MRKKTPSEPDPSAELLKIRDTLKISQEAFARLLEIPLRSYSRYELGKSRVPATVLLKAMSLAKRADL